MLRFVAGDSPYSSGIREGLPIAFGYLPVAITFGLVATQHGLTVPQAVLSSALIFSGAGQFMLVALVAAGASWTVALLLLLLLNTRHVLYGPNLAPRIPARRAGLMALAHGLTDEVFALALSRLPTIAPERRAWWLGGVASMAFATWVAGTAAGALGGAWLTASAPLLAEALEFALPALFLVLVLPYLRSSLGLGVATTIALTAVLAIMDYQAIGIILASLAGALVCYRGMPWIRPRRG